MFIKILKNFERTFKFPVLLALRALIMLKMCSLLRLDERIIFSRVTDRNLDRMNYNNIFD